jgi:cyclic pyranopterin phosphate synthase
MPKLSHLDETGRARMVDVSDKPDTKRVAIAQGQILMRPATLKRILSGKLVKGDALTVAKIAGIQAAKRTHEIIPLCHPIPISNIELGFSHDAKTASVTVSATVSSTSKTGVEMEALTACSVTLLTLYDMAKAVERGMEISSIKLIEKRGGKSGLWKRASKA